MVEAVGGRDGEGPQRWEEGRWKNHGGGSGILRVLGAEAKVIERHSSRVGVGRVSRGGDLRPLVGAARGKLQGLGLP